MLLSYALGMMRLQSRILIYAHARKTV